MTNNWGGRGLLRAAKAKLMSTSINRGCIPKRWEERIFRPREREERRKIDVCVEPQSIFRRAERGKTRNVSAD